MEGIVERVPEYQFSVAHILDAEVNRRVAEKLYELADSLSGSAAAHKAWATIKTKRAGGDARATGAGGNGSGAKAAPAPVEGAIYTALKNDGTPCGGKLTPRGKCKRCYQRAWMAEHDRKTGTVKKA